MGGRKSGAHFASDFSHKNSPIILHIIDREDTRAQKRRDEKASHDNNRVVVVLLFVKMSFTTTTKTTKYENDALEVSIANVGGDFVVGVVQSRTVDHRPDCRSIPVARTRRRRGEKKIKRTKKKYVRFMVQAHIDENHPQHEKAKRGEPITSATLIEEEEKTMNSKKKKKKNPTSTATQHQGADENITATNERREAIRNRRRRKRKKRKRKKRRSKIRTNRKARPKICFVSDNRDKIIKEFSTNSSREEVRPKMAKFERERTGDVHEMAEKDKELYHKEMEKYVPMSDAELNKLKQKAEKEKKEKSENSAFKKPYKCSEKLKTFLGGQETINRAQLTQEMWKYFKENNLMDPENKQFVVCDDKLFKLIGEKRFRAFGFAKYLAKDLIPM